MKRSKTILIFHYYILIASIVFVCVFSSCGIEFPYGMPILQS